MPSKKKKFNARFPPARIKKIMQTDDEVGKVAAAVPVIISRALELFIESLILKTSETTQTRSAKTLTTAHIKQTVLTEKNFDFLKDLVASVPDIQADEESQGATAGEPSVIKPKSGRSKKKTEGGRGPGRPRKERKPSVEPFADDNSEDEFDDDETDEDTQEGTSSMFSQESLSNTLLASTQPNQTSLSTPAPESSLASRLGATKSRSFSVIEHSHLSSSGIPRQSSLPSSSETNLSRQATIQETSVNSLHKQTSLSGSSSDLSVTKSSSNVSVTSPPSTPTVPSVANHQSNLMHSPRLPFSPSVSSGYLAELPYPRNTSGHFIPSPGNSSLYYNSRPMPRMMYPHLMPPQPGYPAINHLGMFPPEFMAGRGFMPPHMMSMYAPRIPPPMRPTRTTSKDDDDYDS